MKSLRPLLLLFTLTFTATAHAQEQAAMAKLGLAVQQCDQALSADQPDTPLGQQVLHRYLRKYQIYRVAAQQIDPKVINSDHLYQSATFGQKTFAELDAQCTAQMQAKLQHEVPAPVLPPLDKHATALVKAAQAIRGWCAAYSRPPYSAGPVHHARLKRDYAAYQQAKQQALAGSDMLAKYELFNVWPDAKTGHEREMKKTVADWFQLCDQAFETYQTAIADLPDAVIAPAGALPVEQAPGVQPENTNMVEPEDADAPAEAVEEAATETPAQESQEDLADQEPPPAEEEQASSEQEAPAEEMDEEEDALFNEVFAKCSGERADILDEAGHLPDFSDNEEQIHQAKTWQYEYEDDNGGLLCVTFKFKGNNVDSENEREGECPGF